MPPRNRFTFLSVTCLVLALALAVLQFATHRSGYYVSYGFGDRPQQLFLFARCGSICAGWETLFVPNRRLNAYFIDPFPLPRHWLGFLWHSCPTNFIVGLPFWFLSCVALAFAVIFWKRRLARLPNFCRNCGYDLRATPDLCPECGTAVATNSAAASPASRSDA